MMTASGGDNRMIRRAGRIFKRGDYIPILKIRVVGKDIFACCATCKDVFHADGRPRMVGRPPHTPGFIVIRFTRSDMNTLTVTSEHHALSPLVST